MSRKIDFSFGAIYNTGGSPVFLGNHESIPKKDFQVDLPVLLAILIFFRIFQVICELRDM
jgi:hypothetical protein